MSIMEEEKGSERYKKLKLLGTGTYGKAYLSEVKNTHELIVIKEIDLTKMDEEERDEALKEVKIMEGLDHPNIIRFREVYRTKENILCIVMDYADGGDLLDKLKKANGSYLPESQILNWFTQIEQLSNIVTIEKFFIEI